MKPIIPFHYTVLATNTTRMKFPFLLDVHSNHLVVVLNGKKKKLTTFSSVPCYWPTQQSLEKLMIDTRFRVFFTHLLAVHATRISCHAVEHLILLDAERST